MNRLAVAFAIAISSFAKEPVTLDAVVAAPEPAGVSAVWSPAGDRFVWRQGAKIEIFEIAARSRRTLLDLAKLEAEAKPTAEPEAFGWTNRGVKEQAIQWSRDGSWLLLALKGDLFLVRVADGTWRQLTKTTGIERDPKLSPDGRRVSFHAQHDLYSLSVGDGKARTIAAETDKAWVNLKDDFRFLSKSREWIFGGERSGYRHLYLQAVDGGAPQPITQGKWEVTDLACVDEAARRVYYVSAEVSARERHLYSIGFDGSGKRQLTAAKGTHTISMAAGCGHYLDSHSSAAEAPAQSLHMGTGEAIELLQTRTTAVADKYEILPNEFIDFRAEDGDLFHARLIRPPGFDPSRKYPAVVQVYGGPHAQHVRDQWRGADWDQYLAHRGFVVWQMDNRGTAGRGHAWEARLFRRFGKQELSDQLEGVRHLISMGFVDPQRVAINGWSYGGFLTLYSLLHAPGVFRAGIAGAPVTDWRQYDTIYTERYLGLPQENEEGYRASSPVHAVDELRDRLLIVHNLEDDNVLFQHSLRMMDALQRAGKQYESLIYPQKAHHVTGPVRKHMLEAMTAFLERSLK